MSHEIWKTIDGFDMYEISSFGRVRSKTRTVRHPSGGTAIVYGKILSPYNDKNGYLNIHLYFGGGRGRLNTKVHRLVAKHFLDSEGLADVNHKDFNKTNNNVSNLEWVSKTDNTTHAVKGGRFCATTNHHRAKKLDPVTVSKIRAARNAGATYKEIGDIFDISAPTVFYIVKGKIWKDTPTDLLA